ncbi:excisionase [Kluyvera intermedia]|uniref:excisionase n=1 Tax=Kluyvera intermedia TaxID=61648 RepID=UPI00242C89F5|nr:excisionase [Kluyvera intermedia]WEJ85868.1 MAG: excisionase [Kluyvera intermedia]
MSRMISLIDWAQEEFGEQAPSERVLKKYAKGRMMAPPAVKVGRNWLVDSEARYVGVIAEPVVPTNSNPRLKRIIADGC